MDTPTPTHYVRLAMLALAVLGAVLAGSTGPTDAATAPTPTSIAQVPLTVVVPAHPQIVIAVGNSESMDGNLSGAIMTGSGSLGAGLALLNNSSSPTNFAIPAGFTPPVDPGAAGSAPYTVNAGGPLVDNSPSRLNVAKAGITAVLNAFMGNADFALETYQLASTSVYQTWLYQMSPPSGFVFSNTVTAAPDRWVANPCYNYTSLPTTSGLYQSCLNIDTSGVVTGSMATSQYMQIDGTIFPTGGASNGGSSDDPLINDVLYAGGLAPVCLVYGGPSPGNPYVNFTLGQYNANPANIFESYSSEVNGCASTTFPTNAGFVSSTPQTMYIRRGFGYYGGQSANTGTMLVPMTTAGASPTTASVNTALGAFSAFLAPETDDPGTPEIKAAGGQSALPGLLRGARQYYVNTHPPSSNGCAPSQYVILLTDGMPTLDINGNSWPPPGTVSAANWGMTVAFNPDGSLDTSGNTNDRAVLDTVAQLQTLKSKGIQTYIIGLGAGVDPTVNPVAAQVLTAFAIAGGTGTYFAATSPGDLTNDLQVILAQILAQTQSTASTAVNSTGLHNGSIAYLGAFTTSDVFQDWTGDLNAYTINPANGQVETPANGGSALWSARAQLDAENWDTGRLIATWDPVAKAGTPFRWNPGLAPAGISSATTGLGLQLATFPADPNPQDVLNYLRGNNAQELRNGGQFRNRAHKLGDIVASAPLYIGAPNGATQTPDYLTFATAHAARPPVIYVGANDGMLHAFDAATGSERFAYIPNGVFNNLLKLVNPYYNQQHQFYVNGSPHAADVKFASDGSWHTVLVGTEGAGGNSVFALDVTAPESITSETQLAAAALWEFTDGDMGLSFSEPTLALTSAGWLTMFGNGYNSPNQKPVLYGLDPQTGAVLAKVDLCAAVSAVCNPALANGLSSVAAVNTTGQITAPVNVVYAGDLQGNVWRVDISDSNPANWQVSVIYQTRDALGAIQPITTVPAVTLNPSFPLTPGTMVFVGTGQLLGVQDLSTTQVQTMYGIYDPPTGSTTPLGFPGIPTRANLQQQVLMQETVTVPVTPANPSGLEAVRTLYNPVAPLPLPPTAGAVRGWYIDLSVQAANGAGKPSGQVLDVGDRIITDPEIESGGGLVFITYQPSTSQCSLGGAAFLMVVNFATGTAFTQPELDVNGDQRIDNEDVPPSGNIPAGMSLGAVYAATPTLLPGGGPATAINKLTSVSSGTVDTVQDRGKGKQRISWWEVRH
jgi:type IV pilus assembly protein PilY1